MPLLNISFVRPCIVRPDFPLIGRQTKQFLGNGSNCIVKNPPTGCSSPCKNYLSYSGGISQSVPNDRLQCHHVLMWNSQSEDWIRESFWNRGHFGCRITFHTVDYTASREDKGSPIVLKIQGRWGEIAFGVRARGGRRTRGLLGKLDLRLEPQQLKLKPALQKESVFLVQIAAHRSAAQVTCRHLAL